ncbi:MAG TPA: hypothetical protein VG935_05115 [Patescibacteria group bacterium]|nr:hypothetical protein [Patescibacteria group bacterium]
MKIGFDLDKIFVDYPPLIPDGLIDRLYRKKANGELLYRMPSRPEQLLRQMSHHPLLRPPIKKNISFLKSLAKDHHRLYLISSRFGFLEEQTSRLMKNLGLDRLFEGVYFNFTNEQPHIFKEKILASLHLDCYVDDDLYLLKYIAKNNPRTNFFWLCNQKDKSHLPTNIQAISDLSQLSHYA